MPGITTFEDKLLELCTHHELIISDYEKYGRTSNQFTYVSDAHSTTSWLDHIICSFDFYSIILDIFILDKLPSSDHLPLCCRYRFDLCIDSRDFSCDDVIIPSINYQWAKASDVEIEKYRLSRHMPAELMKTAIVPILKNRQGKVILVTRTTIDLSQLSWHLTSIAVVTC